MTLKEYLKNNNIKATHKQRSKIGGLLSKLNPITTLVREDDISVRSYEISFLDSEDVKDLIINELLNG